MRGSTLSVDVVARFTNRFRTGRSLGGRTPSGGSLPGAGAVPVTGLGSGDAPGDTAAPLARCGEVALLAGQQVPDIVGGFGHAIPGLRPAGKGPPTQGQDMMVPSALSRSRVPPASGIRKTPPLFSVQ